MNNFGASDALNSIKNAAQGNENGRNQISAREFKATT